MYKPITMFFINLITALFLLTYEIKETADGDKDGCLAHRQIFLMSKRRQKNLKDRLAESIE